MNILRFKPFSVVACLAMIASSCSSPMCNIHGTMPSEKYNDVYIYLVPLHNTDSIGVDSVKIKDGQFNFTTNKFGMSTLRVDYHYRYGLQDLLVVVEPGNVEVVIDAESHGGGTSQNDSLQVWKEAITDRMQKTQLLSQAMREARKNSNQQAIDSIKVEIDSINKAFRKFTSQMADNQPEGTLKTFLTSF